MAFNPSPDSVAQYMRVMSGFTFCIYVILYRVLKQFLIMIFLNYQVWNDQSLGVWFGCLSQICTKNPWGLASRGRQLDEVYKSRVYGIMNLSYRTTLDYILANIKTIGLHFQFKLKFNSGPTKIYKIGFTLAANFTTTVLLLLVCCFRRANVTPISN